ncbi:MAG: DUF2461 domain-containing protein [Tannerellaceae bacterium]
MNAQIIEFLIELRENNHRPWFQENKARYDALRTAFIGEVQQLIDGIAQFDSEVTGLEAKDCLFRIYRDIRFSPDKTPYKTHFSAYIAQGGRSSERGGYYVHLEPGNCMLSGGVWCPPPRLLKMLRQDIYDHIEEFSALLEDPAFKQTYPELDGDTLKRMPTGYPADFASGEILRHKDFCVSSMKPDSFFSSDDWLKESLAAFRQLLPFNQFLNYTVDTYQGR